MQVTVYYTDGTSETFTNVTSYLNVDGWITIEGVDAGGVAGTYQINAAFVRKVQRLGG